jgi:hypothetical protein
MPRTILFSRRMAGAVILTLAASQAAHAESWDRFQGAWATEGQTCNQVFTTKDGKPAFIDQPGMSMSGFIVQGNEIRGLGADCSVASRKESGDTMKLLLHCRSQIIFGDMTVTVKIKDPNTITRVDPDFPEVGTNYTRCN